MGIFVMVTLIAVFAYPKTYFIRVIPPFLLFINQLGRNDAKRHCNYCITGNHGGAGNNLPNRCLGHNIAITNSSNGHYGPVDTVRNTIKAMLWSLHQKHQRAKNNNQNQQTIEKDKNLVARINQGIKQEIGLTDITRQFQYSKYSQNP